MAALNIDKALIDQSALVQSDEVSEDDSYDMTLSFISLGDCNAEWLLLLHSFQ